MSYLGLGVLIDEDLKVMEIHLVKVADGEEVAVIFVDYDSHEMAFCFCFFWWSICVGYYATLRR